MKFLYEYRTPDNAKHQGVVSASDREAAFTALKAMGIKPGRVVEAPGFFNKMFGKGKRWLAIAILSVTVAAAFFIIHSNTRIIEQSSTLFDSSVRRQLIGDSAVIEKGIRLGWPEVFAEPGERFLASFALPGQLPAMMRIEETNLVAAINRTIEPMEDDTIEARQLKAIVEGMKSEIRAYVKEGGTLTKYCTRLVRRQRQEIDYYQRAEQEIEMAKKNKISAKEVEALWEKKNAALRMLGIRLVQMPE